ncbi:MAG: DUF4430 domain-containing protein [Alkalibacterium sp.]|nr:DUF4430 domain-containing protein [Alkalibacterium sp.]
MKKKSNIVMSVVIALLALAIILWVSNQDSPSGSSAEDMKEVTVMIYAEDEELANDTLEVAEDMTLLEIMEDNYEMAVSDEGFVESIEGAEQSVENNLYWVFEANEEMVNESAEDFVPEDGDTVIWELMAF